MNSLWEKTSPSSPHPSMLDPWQAATEWGEGTVLAVITATYGPAYRNQGAAMAISADGRIAGTITGGCVEADLILRAKRLQKEGGVEHLRYGQGSPFFDLRLPCGGAIEITLFYVQDIDVLTVLAQARRARKATALNIASSGRLNLLPWTPTVAGSYNLRLSFRPPIQFLIFGTGAEVCLFSQLVQSLGYSHMLLSHEESSLVSAATAGSATIKIGSCFDFSELQTDSDTAAVLFYHNHDYEIDILLHFLQTQAFYIGAQGSRRAQANRLMKLQEKGGNNVDLNRIRGPIGLIPSAREPKMLAISVMAEIMSIHDQITSGDNTITLSSGATGRAE